MEEKGVSKSCLFVPEARDDSLCAMYLGVSCAFIALKYLSKKALDDQKCVETRDKMLQGSAQLLGLLVWRVQREEVKSIEKCELLHKLEASEREINELKRIRSEDAKANEKVASIYAAQEQGWFAERRRLQHQIGGLLNDLRVLDKRKNEAISDLNGKLQEMEVAMKCKEKMLEEGEKKRKELEEKVISVEAVLEGLRETTQSEARDHSAELLKHKTAFIELVSNQRQLEAELGRALRQAEAAKQQLHFVFEEKEEAVLMVQQLSMEIEKMCLDSEEKDRILSAMMRKSSKLDLVEKQVFLKEVKLSKPKRRKSETEIERRRTLSGSGYERRTLRSMLSRRLSSRLEVFPEERGGNSIAMGTNAKHSDNVFDDWDGEVQQECDEHCLQLDQSLPQQSSAFDGSTRLNEWVHSEAEKYHNAVEQQHQVELDAFAEQMKLKDDKLEAYRWRLRCMELESKRLQSQIEGLKQDMSQLRHDNLKLETLLLDREVQLKTLKDQISLQLNNLSAQKTKFHSSRREPKVKIIKNNPAEEKQEPEKKEEETESLSEETSSSTVVSSTEDTEEKEVIVEKNPAFIEISSPESVETTGNGVMDKLCLNKRDKSQWKVDLHALGVSYKIKRLSQQLLMLDRLTGKQESVGKGNDEHGQIRMKGFLLLLSLLNKQVNRYQSLQQKADDLSQRMGEKDLYINNRVSGTRTKEEKRTLEHFLEETFQLQRFIVATGQKLMEVESKIASGFVGISEELDVSASFDMKRFADTIQSLLKDVQRGLEVRISRIIGDLEGTLARDGIHSRKY